MPSSAGEPSRAGDVDLSSLDSRSPSPDTANPRRRASAKSKKSIKGNKKLHKSPRSPYEAGVPRGTAWRSLAGSVAAHGELTGSRTPRQMWLNSLRQGTGLTRSLKRPVSEGVGGAGGAGGAVPDYLREALGMTRPRHARSAHTGYVPGTPDYKEREAMYDEILELKKALSAERAALETARTRARRLEAEGARRDKQLEQLLAPQAQGSEFTRSLADRKGESGVVINGLKQRVLKLEQQCREKDTALTRLREDVRCTSLEEMRVAAETYLLEIERLRQALAAATPTTASEEGGAAGRHREKALGTALRRLAEKHALVQQHNARLLSELSVAHAAPPPPPPHTGTSGAAATQQQQPTPREAGSRTASARRPAAQEGGAGGEDGQDAARLRGAVRRLKEDRRALQGELAQRDKEIQQQRRATADLEVENKRLSVRQAEEQWREEARALQEKLWSVERELEEERRRGEERARRERSLSPAPADVTSSQSRRSSSDSRGRGSQSRQSSADSQRPGGQSRLGSPQSDGGQRRRGSASPEAGVRSGAARCDKKADTRVDTRVDTRAEAAATIQRQWRRHRERRAEESDGIDEAAQLIQSVMRGHGTRRQLLAEKSPLSPPQGPAHQDGVEPAVILIQSALRAHVTRRGQLENRDQAEPSSAFTASRGGYAVNTARSTARLAP